MALSFILSISLGSGEIVINEVELNPPGYDLSCDVDEWVELYNTGHEDVDMSGWTLSSNSAIIEIPPGIIIPAKGFCVVASGRQWLDNTDESVLIKNSEGTVVDATPSFLYDYDDSDCSWSRYPDGEDTDTSFEWGFLRSSIHTPTSGYVCSPSVHGVFYYASSSIEGNLSPINITPGGRYIAPHGSYFADVSEAFVVPFDYIETPYYSVYVTTLGEVRERTAAFEGSYRSEEVMSSGSSYINVYPQIPKPLGSESASWWHTNRSIDYSGKEINNFEFVGNSQNYAAATLPLQH